jgi:hypothetical protein
MAGEKIGGAGERKHVFPHKARKIKGLLFCGQGQLIKK